MEAYANDACRTVAAQVSEAVGFQGMTQSTADTLAEVLARYIEEVRIFLVNMCNLQPQWACRFLTCRECVTTSRLDISRIH